MQHAPDLAEITPPEVLGAASLTARAFRGESIETLEAQVGRLTDPAARLHDQALLALLRFQPVTGQHLQKRALERGRLFRVGRAPPGRLRVLAVMLPGDLMANTPLGFLLEQEDVRLDLLYHVPGEPLPDRIPDHDVAFFAPSDTHPSTTTELQHLFDH